MEEAGDVAGLAERLAGRLGEWASDVLIVTLGARGAVAVTDGAWYHVQPPRVEVANTAGAGDALDGALMLARSRGAGWPEALSLGTAAAASVVMHECTGMCRREQIEDLLPQVTCVKLARPHAASAPTSGTSSGSTATSSWLMAGSRSGGRYLDHNQEELL